MVINIMVTSYIRPVYRLLGISISHLNSRYRLKTLFAAPMLLLSSALWGFGLESINEIAVFPYLSPQKLVQLYKPLAQDLELKLGHPVRVVSAPNYTKFMERLAQHRYVLVINASHMARMAQLDEEYQPILRPLTDLKAVVVVPRNSALMDTAELRNAVVGVPSRIAQITQIAKAMMREEGLEPGTDITFVHHPTHSSAVMAVANGKAQAAVISSRAMDQLRDRVGDRLRILSDSGNLTGALPGKAPPVIYQVSPLLDIQAREQLVQIITRFTNNTKAGQAFINQFGYRGLRHLEPGEMEAMTPFLPALRAQLVESGK